jgi:two-component system LytT family sensor kinase
MAEQIEQFRGAEIQRLVSQAEFRALQSQINPHFLFNALNTIYGVIPREATGARRTVMNLAEIFRYSLQSDKAFIRLDEELEIVKAYLDIELLRLGPRLQTQIHVDDAALKVPIPILSVQPLVENAVKHGLAHIAGGGWLRLNVKMLQDEVLITVEDTGTGMTGAVRDPESSGAGVGLANLRKRLQLCYGPDADLRIASSSSGTRVQFSVPISKRAIAV